MPSTAAAAPLPRIQYLADGAQTEFPFPFRAFQPQDVLVFLDAAPATPGEGVTVTLSATGGTARFPAPPAEGAVVTITRLLPLTRTSEFQEGGLLRAQVLNTEFDRLVALLQQSALENRFTLAMPLTDPVDEPQPLPPAAERAGTTLGFDAAGLPALYAPASAVTVAANVTHRVAAAGAVARALSERLDERLSVLDFGAVADWDAATGTGTDNGTAFNAAIAAAAGRGGGVVLVPPGAFGIGGTVKVLGSVLLCGAGAEATVLGSLAGEDVAAGILIAGSNCGVRDLTWDGLRDLSGGRHTVRGRGIQITTDHRMEPLGDILVENVVVRNVRNIAFLCASPDQGLYPVRRVRFVGCTSINAGYAGFEAAEGEGIDYVNCLSHGDHVAFNLESHLSTSLLKGVQYVNCRAVAPLFKGFDAQANAGIITDLSYTNCMVDGMTSDPAVIDGPTDGCGFNIQVPDSRNGGAAFLTNCLVRGAANTGFRLIGSVTGSNLVATHCGGARSDYATVGETLGNGFTVQGEIQLSHCLARDNHNNGFSCAGGAAGSPTLLSCRAIDNGRAALPTVGAGFIFTNGTPVRLLQFEALGVAATTQAYGVYARSNHRNCTLIGRTSGNRLEGVRAGALFGSIVMVEAAEAVSYSDTRVTASRLCTLGSLDFYDTTGTSVLTRIQCGAGEPPMYAANGTLYLRTDGGAGKTLYVRESGVWVAK